MQHTVGRWFAALALMVCATLLIGRWIGRAAPVAGPAAVSAPRLVADEPSASAIDPMVRDPLSPTMPSADDGATGETATSLESLVAGLLRAVEFPTPAPVRVPRPEVPPGPRRVGIQAGHWLASEVPDELRRLEAQTGTSWNGIAEWRLNLDVANRAAELLRGRGYHVDVLPTTVPPGYLADVFVSLHADGDPSGTARGYKAARGSRRGPYEDLLVRIVMEEYGRATGLPVDPGVTRNMLGYYAFAWGRVPYSAAPHTPAAILEMGFLSSAADRAILLGRQDLVVAGVVNAIQRFLDEVPAGAAFAEDLILPPAPARVFRTPTPETR